MVAPDGTVRTGRRHVRGFLPVGRHWIPIAAEDLPVGGAMEVRIRVDADDGFKVTIQWLWSTSVERDEIRWGITPFGICR